MEEYCSHGNRFLLWLPYRGWEGNTENVTYGTTDNGEQLELQGAWKNSKIPTTSSRPWCVIAQLGRKLSESLQDSGCDLWDSIYGWDRAPCSACTIPNQATKSIEFKPR